MKKLIFILALLLITASAWAGKPVVNVVGVDTWNDEVDPNISYGEVFLGYDQNSPGSPVRAWALTIDVTGPNVFIDWTERFEAGWDNYWLTPTTYDGEDPAAEIEEGENAVTMIYELASLYAEGEDPPPDVCGLALFGVGGDAGGEVCVDVYAEPIRGGIVLENVTAVGLHNDPCCFTLAEQEIPEPLCGDLNEVEVAVWEGWAAGEGEPNNWCEPCWKCGDINKDGFVGFSDVQLTLDLFIAVDTTGEGDYNMDSFLSFADVQDVLDKFIAAEGCTPCE
ncbi:MAG: hypothetical protein ACYSRQ_04495 [Planctomycetota bacterium]|jgi:hypothetical protein